jgi:hypothetical protein
MKVPAVFFYDMSGVSMFFSGKGARNKTQDSLEYLQSPEIFHFALIKKYNKFT